MKIAQSINIETMKKIKQLIIDDYKSQLEELKKQKSNYDYTTYRKKYVNLNNAIQWHKKDYNKLMGE